MTALQTMPEQLPVVTSTNPLAILSAAVERGHSADQLEKLTALAERWERYEAEKRFNEAMHACQQAMPQVVRDAQNSHTKSKYALLESLQKQCRPVYSENGFSLCFGEADCPLNEYKRTVCDVSHTAGHTRRYHLDLPIDGTGAKGGSTSMNAVQGCISTTSYGQRRLLCMIFNVTIAGEDDDGQAASGGGMAEHNRITPDLVDKLSQQIKEGGTTLKRILDWAQSDTLDNVTVGQYKQLQDMYARNTVKK